MESPQETTAQRELEQMTEAIVQRAASEKTFSVASTLQAVSTRDTIVA